MYKNIHNKDLCRIIDLTFAKEIWDRLHLMNAEARSNRAKKEKREEGYKTL